MRVTCVNWTRSPRIAGRPSASSASIEAPLSSISRRLNAMTSRITSLISNLSFRGGTFLIPEPVDTRPLNCITTTANHLTQCSLVVLSSGLVCFSMVAYEPDLTVRATVSSRWVIRTGTIRERRFRHRFSWYQEAIKRAAIRISIRGRCS